MQFYTNVAQWGNTILLREYKNGERVNRKIKYSPTMYVPVQKKTEYKTLDGKYATPYKFDTIKEAKQFIENTNNNLIWSLVWIGLHIHFYMTLILIKFLGIMIKS